MKKKMAALVLAALTVTGMSVTASADTTLTKIGTASYAQWVDGTNLLRVEGAQGYSLTSLDGSVSTDSIYSHNIYFEEGYLTASLANGGVDSYGVLSLQGEEIVPFQYSYLDAAGEHWILAYMLREADSLNYDFSSSNWYSDEGDTYYLIETVDIYYTDGTAAAAVGTLTRDQFLDAYAEGKYINIEDRATGKVTTYGSDFEIVAEDVSFYDFPEDAYGDLLTFDENGQEGLMDTDGNIILEPSYYIIYDFYNGYAEVSTGDFYGLIDEQGNEVIPAEYDSIETSYYLPASATGETSGYNALGYFAVEKDGKLGFMNEQGVMTCEPKYASTNMELNGASAVLTDLEGNTILVAADGVETMIEGYESIYPLYYASGMLYQVTDEEYNYGIIDWHGNVVLPCEYYDLELSGDGNYLLLELDYDENSEIYQISYDTGASAVGAEAPVLTEETEAAGTAEGAESAEAAGAAEDAESSEVAETTGMEDVPDEEQGSGSAASAVALLDSAVLLLDTDAETNRAAVKELLTNASALLTGSYDDAVTLLNNAAVLLDAESIDTASVKALLTSAKTLIG